MMEKIRVTIWNEFIHEAQDGEVGEEIRKIYPHGIHAYLQAVLQADDLNIRTATLNEPEFGLPDEVLNSTDVLLWWGHCAHDRVSDELVDKIQARIRNGMGLIVLHSGHFSKIFKRMMGTRCQLHWREVGEKERVWVVAPSHPIAQGIPETFSLPHSEMYGESFDIPDDGKIVFMSWYEGGNVFRSGVAFHRDAGKIFYFSPGHETYPIYHDKTIQQILLNGIRWAKPIKIFPKRQTETPSALETITSKNPFVTLNTALLHQQK
ncbi:MAG: ThuA domain-containing protein [Lentisphaeria bacterium]